jgi:hypothetical protein
MALWGNKDSVYSAGTIAVDAFTGIGTGAVGVVTWTSAGIATGDILSLGTGGASGQGVISGFTSTTISVASTAGFVAGFTTTPLAYNISQQPIYTLGDYSYHNDNDTDGTFKDFSVTASATTTAGVGTDIIPVVVGSLDVIVGDAIVNGGSNVVISTIGATTVSLASTISVGIDTGDTVAFRRKTGGYFKDVFGVDRLEVAVAAGTTVDGKNAAYAVAHQGWVGIQTYIDCHGKLRVKSEVLVAGGILTTTDAADDARFPDS